MSLFATIRSTEGTWLRRDVMPRAGAGVAVELQPPHVAEPRYLSEPPLPRHVLIALATIIADVTSLRRSHHDDPAGPALQVEASLDSILGKLDCLVDSIYDRAVGGV